MNINSRMFSIRLRRYFPNNQYFQNSCVYKPSLFSAARYAHRAIESKNCYFRYFQRRTGRMLVPANCRNTFLAGEFTLISSSPFIVTLLGARIGTLRNDTSRSGCTARSSMQVVLGICGDSPWLSHSGRSICKQFQICTILNMSKFVRC